MVEISFNTGNYKDWFRWFCIILKIISIIACIFLIIVNLVVMCFTVITIYELFINFDPNGIVGSEFNLDWLDQLYYRTIFFFLCAFCIVWAICIIIVEIDLTFYMRYFTFLRLWVFKGIFIFYLGIVTLAMCFFYVYMRTDRQPTETVTQFGWIIEIFRQISGWCLILVGIMYILLNLFCFHVIRKRRREQEVRFLLKPHVHANANLQMEEV